MTVAAFGERFFREIVKRDRKDTTVPRRNFDKSIAPAIGRKPVRHNAANNALKSAQSVRCTTSRRSPYTERQDPSVLAAESCGAPRFEASRLRMIALKFAGYFGRAALLLRH